MRRLRRICVYCGSSNHVAPSYLSAARQLGHWLATHDIGVVFGGGHVGLMGQLADAALEAGGEVIGVIPQKLLDLELAHPHATQMFIVPDMHTRKAKMSELADAFIALPGGYGTLEELFEAITWAQLHFHTKPVGLLDVDRYYQSLLVFLDHATSEQFIRPAHRTLLVHDTDIDSLIGKLGSWTTPALDSWITNP